MKRLWILVAVVVGIAAATVMAQPPGGPGGRGGRGGPPGGGQGGGPGGDFRPPPNPVIESIDADHDHVISSDEINNAAQALRSLDKNNDGKLSEDETRPTPPRGQRDGGPPGRGAQGRGPQGRGQPNPPDDLPDVRPRGRGGEDGPRGRGGDDGPRGRGPQEGGPPNPDRFVDDAFRFDADNDGKLSREELRKFAEEMANRRPPRE